MQTTNESVEPLDMPANLVGDVQFLKKRLETAERRLRVMGGLFSVGLVGMICFPLAMPAVAQYGPTLQQLATQVAALQTKTASMTVLTDPNTNQPTVRFSNVNIQIVSGSGSTESPVNGRGNLIVGYNETGNSNGDVRTGSHNLIVGTKNSYNGLEGVMN